MRPVIYDATLREGAQGAGASFTVEDKVRIVDMLDELGVAYIEAGNPGSHPKDAAFYERMRNHPLRQAKLVAFGATCRVGGRPEDDANIQALMSAQTPVVCKLGKSWDFHVTEILKATLEENLNIIKETVEYFKAQGKEVVYDAEHFYDGYKNNPEYALRTLQAAHDGGADWLCLCETNGGCFPMDVEKITRTVVERFGDNVGIHSHNDTGMAEANAVVAVHAGATMVQVTIAGWGERCGNTDLFTLLPNLQLKMGHQCVPPENLQTLVDFAHSFHELANMGVNPARRTSDSTRSRTRRACISTRWLKTPLRSSTSGPSLSGPSAPSSSPKWPEGRPSSRKYSASCPTWPRTRRTSKRSSTSSRRWNTAATSSRARTPHLS